MRGPPWWTVVRWEIGLSSSPTLTLRRNLKADVMDNAKAHLIREAAAAMNLQGQKERCNQEVMLHPLVDKVNRGEDVDDVEQALLDSRREIITPPVRSRSTSRSHSASSRGSGRSVKSAGSCASAFQSANPTHAINIEKYLNVVLRRVDV